jgi:hypothetical protein
MDVITRVGADLDQATSYPNTVGSVVPVWPRKNHTVYLAELLREVVDEVRDFDSEVARLWPPRPVHGTTVGVV